MVYTIRFSSLVRCFCRILKFTDSHYTTPYGIDGLEERGKQGDIILVEGVRTGSAFVWTKVTDSTYEVMH